MTNIGTRLKKLRIEHGYSQIQLAEYLEIDQSNLSKIENDKRNLNLTLLDKICYLYNCTHEYILGKSNEYKKQKIMFKSGNDTDLNAIAKINQLSYHLKTLRELDDAKNNCKLPKLNINVRRQLGIDEYSPINIFTLLPQKIPNLTIVFLPMKRNVSGCCYKKNVDSIILINSLHSQGYQNLTAAHELYHLLDNDKNFFICSEGLNEIIEEKADDFASKFLITEHALYDFIDTNNIEEWTINDVVKCEQYFQIDHNSLIKRLYCEELIGSSQFADFSLNIISKSAILGYDTSLYQSPENRDYFSIGHMIPLTEKIYNEEKISLGRKKDILLDLFRYDLAY